MSSPSSGASREQLPGLSASAQGRPRPGRSRDRAVLRMIALQYNPDTLTRTLQVQATGETGDRSQALRLKGAAVETIKLEAEIDATDRLERPRRRTRDAVELGIHPQLAALEALVQPRADDLQANDALAGAGRARGAAARGAADALRLEQAARRAGARHRPVDHRGGVRRRAQPDPREGLRSACGCSRSTTSASTTAAARCSWATCGTRRRSPARAGSVALVRARAWRRSDVPDPLQELLAAGAVPTTSFPPTSRYAGRRRRRVAPIRGGERAVPVAVPAPPARARARSGSRCSTRCASSRATAATCSPRAHLGDAELWWRLADANGVDRPARPDRAGRPARCASRCPTDVPGGADG